MPVTLPSSSAAGQGQTPGAKSGDTPVDTPFSQVFSGELARKAGETGEDVAAELGALPTEALVSLADATPRPDFPGFAATTAEAAARKAPDASVEEMTDAAAEDAFAAPIDALVSPDMLLAFATAAEGLKPAAAATASVPASGESDAAVSASDVLAPRNATVRAAPESAVGPEAAASASSTRGTPLPATTATAATAATAASAEAHAAVSDATAFTERLATARQSDPANVGERLSELMSHPGLRAAAPAVPAAAAAAPVDLSSRLPPSVGSTAWGQALGEKLVWMAAGNQQTASITLNPPNLGPLQIVVNVSNDQATANFFAAQPEVRQAIESAFPKLREMMNEAGIQLGQATVSAETPRQQDAPQREAPRGAPSFAERGEHGADPVVQHTVPLRQGGRGLVDTFA